MLDTVRRALPRRRHEIARDELGGSEDGGLAIIVPPDETIHVTPSRTANALRYLLARTQSGDQVLPQRIAITSALRGEGVTYLTRSLASVLAYDTELSVALVDLNWRLPAAPAKGEAATKTESTPDAAIDDVADDETDEAALPSEPAPTTADRNGRSAASLADVLAGDADVVDAIQQTMNPRLSLLTAGELALARRPAVAGGKALSTLVEEVATLFDHVILDLPPVLASSDAIQLAHLSDAYVLVVLQAVTREQQIESAIKELAGVESLGVILNRFDSKVPKFLRRMVES